jgi:hypothetical protein
MSEIALATTCSVCKKKFYGPAAALRGLKAGEAVPPRMQHFLQTLFMHVAEAHPERHKLADMLKDEYFGWMILSLYHTDDDQVQQQTDFFRWKTHQRTLRATAHNLDLRAQQVATEFIDAKMEILKKHIVSLKADAANAAAFGDEPSTPPLEFATIMREMQDDLADAIEDVLMELREILEEPDKYSPAPSGNQPETPSAAQI